MSDLVPAPDELEHAERRRAVWGLTILGLVAALIVAVMVFVLGTSPGGHPRAALPGDTGALTHGSTATSPSGRPTSATSSAATSSSVAPTPTATGNPCPSSTSCVVPGDAGQAVQALNAYRTSHGAAAVPGSVSADAQQCAMQHGDGPTCQPQYSWEPVGSTQDGAKVIDMIAGRGAGWLLDSAMTSFSVGWVYFPSGSGGHYECAVLKTG